MEKKIGNKFFVFEIIASEFAALSSLYQEANTCHRQSVCQETVLRFCISLTETFCQATAVAVINKYGKGTVPQISTKFGHIYHVAFLQIVSNGTLWAFI